jgi:hypothetical protein
MYFEAMGPHHTPHFHAYYQNEVAVYQINLVFLTKAWVQCVELKKCAFPCQAGAKQKQALFWQAIL